MAADQIPVRIDTRVHGTADDWVSVELENYALFPLYIFANVSTTTKQGVSGQYQIILLATQKLCRSTPKALKYF